MKTIIFIIILLISKGIFAASLYNSIYGDTLDINRFQQVDRYEYDYGDDDNGPDEMEYIFKNITYNDDDAITKFQMKHKEDPRTNVPSEEKVKYCVMQNKIINIFGGMPYWWSARMVVNGKGDLYRKTWDNGFFGPYNIDEELLQSQIPIEVLLPLDAMEDEINWYIGDNSQVSSRPCDISHTFDQPDANPRFDYQTSVQAQAIQINDNSYTFDLSITVPYVEFINLNFPVTIPLSSIQLPDMVNDGPFSVHLYCQCPSCTYRQALKEKYGDTYGNDPWEVLPHTAALCKGACKESCPICLESECCFNEDCPYTQQMNDPTIEEPDVRVCTCEYEMCEAHRYIYCKTHGSCYYCGANNATASLELPWQL